MKEYLGGEYSKYFESNNSTEDIARPLEFVHYNEIVIDEQITSPVAYRASKQAHVYCLLRRLMYIFSHDDEVAFNL